MSDTTERNLCRHIHLAGRRCGSPALRGETFCYFHHTTRRPPKHLGQDPLDAVFTVPPLEDADIIQHTIGDVLARIATNSIDTKRARLLLFGLNAASRNLNRGCRAARPQPQPHPAEVDAVIEDLELDPTLGPLAPVTPIDAEDEAHKSLMQKFVEYCERPPNRCKVCEWRATTDANKAEGRRLMAEVARRRAAGLPEYPIDAHQPYPADLAWAAEERRLGLSNGIPPSPKDCYLDPDLAEGEEPGASPGESRHPDRSAQRAVEGPPHLPSPSSAPPHVEDPHNPALPNPSPETWAKFAAHLPNIKASAEDPTEPGAPSSTLRCRNRATTARVGTALTYHLPLTTHPTSLPRKRRILRRPALHRE
jgi:hypothetical protein